MAIGNLSNKVSKDDINRVNEIRNPPEHEPGFEPEDDGGDFDSLFGDDDFAFDSLSSDDFGGSTGGGGADSLDDIFGSSSGGGNSFGTGTFGTGTLGQQNQQKKEPDILDNIMDSSGEAVVSIWKIVCEMFKSIKNRSADDCAYYSNNMLIIGIVSAAIGVLLCIVGWVSGMRILYARGLSGQIIGCGVLSVGTGLMGIGFAAIQLSKADRDNNVSLSDISDVKDVIEDDSTDEYEDSIGDMIDDLFGDSDDSDFDSDSLFDDSDFSDNDEDKEDTFEPNMDNIEYSSQELDFSSKLENVQENGVITRELLFNTFKTFFPTNTPEFAEKKEIDSYSEDFQTIETICLKALANVAKCEMEDVKSKLESATESYFSYELRLKRIKGITKTDDIAREMEAYFRESSTDTSVNATVDIEGDFYKIIVTKGVQAVVTFGDTFKHSYIQDFFLNKKNKLPIMVGVSELGEVILADAKIYDTMMIAGKPRSGKSWYVLSILIALMAFNSPEDVQFIIVDPKESNLFNTLSLMPHVCGLHNDSNIMEIMKDIIDNEGARRKKILADNKCDDIWALWKKGIKLPILYIVIDEFITVKNNLGVLWKDFNELMQTVISQLPSQGIRLMFVPHRATGVVDKTNRTMIAFSAAVRSNIDDVNDTLDIKKWSRALVNPGDVAVKTSDMINAMYVRGTAITTDDDDNTDLIENMAKAFYKMGVDLPDMSSLQVAFNRDENKIRKELLGANDRVQYNASNIFNDID